MGVVSEVSAAKSVVAESNMGSDEGILRGLEGKRARRRLVESKRLLFMILCMSVLEILGHFYHYRLGFSL
jgi:hypothetical protein